MILTAECILCNIQRWLSCRAWPCTYLQSHGFLLHIGNGCFYFLVHLRFTFFVSCLCITFNCMLIPLLTWKTLTKVVCRLALVCCALVVSCNTGLSLSVPNLWSCFLSNYVLDFCWRIPLWITKMTAFLWLNCISLVYLAVQIPLWNALRTTVVGLALRVRSLTP